MAKTLQTLIRDDTLLEDGIRYFNLKRYDAALDYFLRLRDPQIESEQRQEAAYYTGLCYTKLEKYEDALLYLEMVVTTDKSSLRSAQCRLTLAYIYMVTKRVKMAEFELERLLSNGMESTQIYAMLAYSAWTHNDTAKALEHYEKAIQLDSSNTTAINGLGYVLADSGSDTKRAIELCRKAVQEKPQNAAYLDSLGWAYYKAGKTVEARNTLRSALEFAPRNHTIPGHMKAVLG
jgi:tetratricopeptide (TPR) repeat protein